MCAGVSDSRDQAKSASPAMETGGLRGRAIREGMTFCELYWFGTHKVILPVKKSTNIDIP